VSAAPGAFRQGGRPSYGHLVLTLDEVAGLAADLPETAEGVRHGNRVWSVRGKVFAWERPFTKADLRRFGDEEPPGGEILAVRVADLHEKEAVLAAHPRELFTIEHFADFAAVLVRLDQVSAAVLGETLTDGWLACAPPALAERHRAG